MKTFIVKYDKPNNKPNGQRKVSARNAEEARAKVASAIRSKRWNVYSVEEVAE